MLACCTHSILATATAISSLSQTNCIFCWQSRVPTAYYHVTMLPKIYAEFQHDNQPDFSEATNLLGAHYTVLNFHQQRLPCCPSVVNIMDCEKLYCSSFASNFVF